MNNPRMGRKETEKWGHFSGRHICTQLLLSLKYIENSVGFEVCKQCISVVQSQRI